MTKLKQLLAEGWKHIATNAFKEADTNRHRVEFILTKGGRMKVLRYDAHTVGKYVSEVLTPVERLPVYCDLLMDFI